MNEIDKYLDEIPSSQKDELVRIRQIIKNTVPEAVEAISYGMPVFKYKGKYLIGYAGFKNHMSVFPGSEPIEESMSKLKGYKISKGTIQFTKEKPLSETIIIEIIKNCVNRIDNKN